MNFPFHKNRLPHLQKNLNYLRFRKTILEGARKKVLYRRVWLWHGTGRYEDGGAVDILTGILNKGEIRPHQDVWDRTLRTTETISATRMRHYAVMYSDMHLQTTAEELVYKDPREAGKYIVRLVGFYHPISIMRGGRHVLRQKEATRRWMGRYH